MPSHLLHQAAADPVTVPPTEHIQLVQGALKTGNAAVVQRAFGEA